MALCVSDVLLLNYNTDIEAYYIMLTEVIIKDDQRVPCYHVCFVQYCAYLQLVGPY